MMHRIRLLLLTTAVAAAGAFGPFLSTHHSRTSRGNSRIRSSGAAARFMVKFDGEKWVPESDAERPEAGYGVGRTFLKHGPLPAFRRIFQPADYEQAVLKFMDTEGCDRNVAQGNMDCYMRNLNDWFYMRAQEEKLGVKFDYVTIDPKGLILVSVWTLLLFLFAEQFLEKVKSGEIDFVSTVGVYMSSLLSLPVSRAYCSHPCLPALFH
jgi:hypothetical protein